MDLERKTGEGRGGRGELLVVSWHFGTNGATGGFRWAHMARHLCEAGWSIDVLTVAEPGDAGSGGVRVHVVPAAAAVERLAERAGRLASAVKRMLGSVRGGNAAASAPFAVSAVSGTAPEPRTADTGVAGRVQAALEAAPYRAWNRRVVREGMRLAGERKYRAVIVSSPPHLTLLAGAEMGRRLGIPFIADLRDAWVAGLAAESLTRLPPAHRILGERYEPAVVRSARLVVHNTEEAKAAAARAMPGQAVRRATIRNGSDFEAVATEPDPRTFRVLFSGWIYDYMDLPALVGAFGRFLRRRKPGEAAVLEFQGAPEGHRGTPLVEIASAAGVAAPHLHFSDRAPREEALRTQMRASMLVAFDCHEPICVPMKVYDYACMRGELLLLGHPTGAMAAVAAEIGRRVISPADERAVDAAFDEAWDRWLRGDWRGPHDPDGRLSRRRQSGALSDLLEDVLAANAATARPA